MRDIKTPVASYGGGLVESLRYPTSTQSGDGDDLSVHEFEHFVRIGIVFFRAHDERSRIESAIVQCMHGGHVGGDEDFFHLALDADALGTETGECRFRLPLLRVVPRHGNDCLPVLLGTILYDDEGLDECSSFASVVVPRIDRDAERISGKHFPLVADDRDSVPGVAGRGKTVYPLPHEDLAPHFVLQSFPIRRQLLRRQLRCHFHGSALCDCDVSDRLKHLGFASGPHRFETEFLGEKLLHLDERLNLPPADVVTRIRPGDVGDVRERNHHIEVGLCAEHDDEFLTILFEFGEPSISLMVRFEPPVTNVVPGDTCRQEDCRRGCAFGLEQFDPEVTQRRNLRHELTGIGFRNNSQRHLFHQCAPIFYLDFLYNQDYKEKSV